MFVQWKCVLPCLFNVLHHSSVLWLVISLPKCFQNDLCFLYLHQPHIAKTLSFFHSPIYIVPLLPPIIANTSLQEIVTKATFVLQYNCIYIKLTSAHMCQPRHLLTRFFYGLRKVSLIVGMY